MKKQINIGDKVTFKLGYGIVIDKYRDTTGHYWKYDIQLLFAHQSATADGYAEDDINNGKIYSTRFVNLD